MSYRRHTFRTVATAAIALAAITPAAASARFDIESHPVYLSPARPTVEVMQHPSGTFDWGDAAIGAAAGVGASALALGGATAIAGRRRRTAATPTAREA
jgi:hypothetical protein